MTREEKHQLVAELQAQFQASPNFYVLDLTGMNVAKTNDLRRKCFESNMKLQTVKNSLLVKALEGVDTDYANLPDALKGFSAVLFVGEDLSGPAKWLKTFKADAATPEIKAAFVEQTTFVGGDLFKELSNVKTKTELLGELVGLLQSPAKNVVGALQSAPNKVAGLVKALEERAA
jgi:large subunit ribosomal protein L10